MRLLQDILLLWIVGNTVSSHSGFNARSKFLEQRRLGEVTSGMTLLWFILIRGRMAHVLREIRDKNEILSAASLIHEGLHRSSYRANYVRNRDLREIFVRSRSVVATMHRVAQSLFSKSLPEQMTGELELRLARPAFRIAKCR